MDGRHWKTVQERVDTVLLLELLSDAVKNVGLSYCWTSVGLSDAVGPLSDQCRNLLSDCRTSAGAPGSALTSVRYGECRDCLAAGRRNR